MVLSNKNFFPLNKMQFRQLDKGLKNMLEKKTRPQELMNGLSIS